MTPTYLGFPELENDSLALLDLIMNALFGIDVVINFFSVYYGTNFNIEDDIRVIIFILNL